MKICLVGSSESFHIQRWCRFLSSRGHDVVVLSNRRTPLEEGRVEFLPSLEKWGNWAYPLSLPFVRRALRRHRPDIVHFHYLGGASLYVFAVGGARVFATPWGSDLYGLRSPVMSRIVRKLLSRARRILTTSEAMAAWLTSRYGVERAKIRAISWGIETRLFRPAGAEEKAALRRKLGFAGDDFVIISPRTMAPLYRTGLIIDAFPAVRKKVPGAKLVVITGDRDASAALGEYRRGLAERAAAEAGIRIIPGPIDAGGIADLIRVSDAAVSIPLSDQRSTSVLEALSVVPGVVLADLPAYRELERDGYRFVRLGEVSTACLAAALVACAARRPEEKRAVLERNHALILGGEDWETQAGLVEAEYRAAAGGPDAPPARSPVA